MTSCFLQREGSILKGKNFSFPFRVDLSEGSEINFERVSSCESVTVSDFLTFQTFLTNILFQSQRCVSGKTWYTTISL